MPTSTWADPLIQKALENFRATGSSDEALRELAALQSVSDPSLRAERFYSLAEQHKADNPLMTQLWEEKVSPQAGVLNALHGAGYGLVEGATAGLGTRALDKLNFPRPLPSTGANVARLLGNIGGTLGLTAATGGGGAAAAATKMALMGASQAASGHDEMEAGKTADREWKERLGEPLPENYQPKGWQDASTLGNIAGQAALSGLTGGLVGKAQLLEKAKQAVPRALQGKIAGASMAEALGSVGLQLNDAGVKTEDYPAMIKENPAIAAMLGVGVGLPAYSGYKLLRGGKGVGAGSPATSAVAAANPAPSGSTAPALQLALSHGPTRQAVQIDADRLAREVSLLGQSTRESMAHPTSRVQSLADAMLSPDKRGLILATSRDNPERMYQLLAQIDQGDTDRSLGNMRAGQYLLARTDDPADRQVANPQALRELYQILYHNPADKSEVQIPQGFEPDFSGGGIFKESPTTTRRVRRMFENREDLNAPFLMRDENTGELVMVPRGQFEPDDPRIPGAVQHVPQARQQRLASDDAELSRQLEQLNQAYSTMMSSRGAQAGAGAGAGAGATIAPVPSHSASANPVLNDPQLKALAMAMRNLGAHGGR